MKIGLFGGTFNPVHLGHLRAVEEVREYFLLNKIVFIPAGVPPLKKYDLTEATHRLNMTKLAVQDNPYFEVSDFEVKQNKPSYTVNTVAYFKKVYEKDMLFFIMGIDAFLELKLWYRYRDLLRMVDFIVMSRPGFNSIENSEFIEYRESKNCFKFKNSDKKLFYLAVSPYWISSRVLREMIHEGRSVRYLVTEEIRKYIDENKLYRE
ncbi:MAG TPA: nicotinate-nucleotide adenylyltransferase [Thermodesulfovibrio thiophilus]|uniref:nicotinate-nucleotide adenylyltransferase n=1 Tax=Thermodesulfovibrio thiophilus TaxID=340095 RepID=UPI0017FE49FB|nr:nicotinate-nucleotide adenylyltransferase [Thermodesulfovibrio thiophilus]HHW19814.1 nicotinate (nicotinamide) nucleotide adenylyltransferase [Thermodesulfovibrio thiophilus]HOA82587.1 nicotinate-nucleotide adenylyltransferase [Thermodesulfovibrio thiophilus]HQD35579.1 nicotinate-nucleotide adenylyltransferase [Thermodesulfovibrio thiophilus]